MTMISSTVYNGAGAPSVAPGATPAAPAAAPAAPVDSALSTVKPVAAPAPASGPAAAPAVAPAPVAPLTLIDPAAAPVAAPAPVAEAPAPAADGKVTEVVYDKTGNASLDVALGFLGKQGYGPDHPAMLAAAEGNFGILKAELAAKGVAGASEYLALGEESYKATKAASEAKVTADRGAIETAVGGPANWVAIQTWASKNATPAERADVNKGLAVGGVVAKATAEWLASKYAKASGTVVEPVNGIIPGGVVTPGASDNGALAPRPYADAVRKLASKIGSGDMENSPEYKALQSRRRAWRG